MIGQVVRRSVMRSGGQLSGKCRFSSVIGEYLSQSGEVSLKSDLPVSFEDISRAHYRIQGGVKRTVCFAVVLITNTFYYC